MPTELEVAVEAAEAAAAIVRAGFGATHDTRLKGAVDPVTVIDTEAEQAIRSVLARARPADGILGEEEGGSGWDTDRVWVVDPLDGTVNYVHGLPHVSVSVALWIEGRPEVGVIIDVSRRETFAARAGGGATLNEKAIRVSPTTEMTASLVATGFPYDRQRHADAYASVLGRVLGAVQGIRRLGSAALDLAWVACGRYDAYWEYGLAPWDAAAGSLIVAEAAGQVTDHTGRPHRPDSRSLVASNGVIHEPLRAIVEANLPGHLR